MYTYTFILIKQKEIIMESSEESDISDIEEQSSTIPTQEYPHVEEPQTAEGLS